MPAVKVFIAGSRALLRLNDAMRKRLDRIISEQHDVLLGDANGADRIVQQYFADHRYGKVTVFCTGTRCRNNVGNWATVAVAPPAGVHNGREFYTVKDQEMAANATHGLMLWDGESRGTFANIRNLIRDSKPVVVYFTPTKEFVTLKTPADIDVLLAQPSARQEDRRRA